MPIITSRDFEIFQRYNGIGCEKETFVSIAKAIEKRNGLGETIGRGIARTRASQIEKDVYRKFTRHYHWEQKRFLGRFLDVLDLMATKKPIKR